MVDELKRVMGAVTSVNHSSVDWQDSEHALSVASDFFRDHGQALVGMVEDAERYRTIVRLIYSEWIQVGEAEIGMRIMGACPSPEDISSAIDLARAKDAARGEV